MDLIIRTSAREVPGLQPVEVVERKGVGHPDTICDALAEGNASSASAGCTRSGLDSFFTTTSTRSFCAAVPRAPRSGAASCSRRSSSISAAARRRNTGASVFPWREIAAEACRGWLRSHLPELDVDRHVSIIPRIRPGSRELVDLFARGAVGTPLANDTSCGVGFAPLTDLERTVLEVERSLNSDEAKRAYPAIGRDVKVMGVRREAHISLTIGCAIVDRFVADLAEYTRAKTAAAGIALEAARRVTRLEVEAVVNAADDEARGDVFLTVTGTSAEAGDDGEVGRGNRTSGLITPYRPMTLEAAAGKNPVTHVGKLYNVAASVIAAAISDEVSGVIDATCVLVSQIGRPITDPQVVDVQLTLANGVSLDDVTTKTSSLVRAHLARLPQLRERLLAGQMRLY